MKVIVIIQIKKIIPKSIKNLIYKTYYTFLEIKLSLKNFLLKKGNHIKNLPILLLVHFLRLIEPFLLIRIGIMRPDAIGHFAANTEMYLCARDFGLNKPPQPCLDLWFYWVDKSSLFISNTQLDRMWRRNLHILPSSILLPLWKKLSKMGGKQYPTTIVNIKPNVHNLSNSYRDIYNLLDIYSPHLKFLHKEEKQGQAYLQKLGIPVNKPFICLIVRDSAYHNETFPDHNLEYHNYRNCDIQNFVLAAETLADRDYYVVRMGAAVNKPINTSHPKIIDYATNGMRNDFMDIYLGAKCKFCISTGTGFDSVPDIFRRPIIYTNFVPLGLCHTFSQRYLTITKHHWCRRKNRRLSLKEIFAANLGLCRDISDYETQDIKLIENSPEEIKAVVLEMVERLEGNWQAQPEDEKRQQRFWEIFPKDELWNGEPIHGEIRARFGAEFLRQDPEWLD
jgi:putative glycosyltransferase (TIGR04372 family)